MKEIIINFFIFIDGEIKFQIQHIGRVKERWVEYQTKPMREFKVAKSREMTIRLDSDQGEEMFETFPSANAEGNFPQ